MSTWPGTLWTPNTISPLSHQSIGAAMSALYSFMQSNTFTYTTANLAIYVPFAVAAPIVITQGFVLNGGTLSGNIDIGIYTLDGRRLVSKGSTAQTGTSQIQALDITDTELGRGVYYMAFACSNTAATFRGLNLGGSVARGLGLLQQASAFSLPATATFASFNQNGSIPLFGLTTRAVV